MKKEFVWILLLGVILLAIILRFWQLGKVPISPDWDEAALGYNSYSILQTGRDEYGESFPIVLRSFDDYKPALYAYLTIPSILLFGLNTFAVRLPSAIFGIIAVISVFFLVKELFKKDSIALLSSFLLAVSPWHLQFSRIAFESSVGLLVNILVALTFLKGLKKPWFLVISAILSGINIYIYQSEKVFTPLLVLSLAIIFRKELFKIPKKFLFISVLLGLLIVSPMVYYTLSNKEALGRARGVSIFSESTQILKENSLKILEDKKNNDVIGLIVDNRRIEFAKLVVSGYLSHFNLNWLFISGDIARHHAPNMGLMYFFELPFLFLGIYYLFFGPPAGGFERKTKLLIFAWFLIAPVPASITTGVPHAVRTLNFLPTFQIFTAIGVIFALRNILKIKYPFGFAQGGQISKVPASPAGRQIKYLIFSLFILFFIFNFYYYLNQYFVQQNYFNAAEWQYGYEKTVGKIKEIEKNYNKIVISNEPPMDQSYMFLLFYLKYPPGDYQKESEFASGGFRENHKYGKFEFRPIDWEKEKRDRKTLYVGRPSNFPDIHAIFEEYYPNGGKAMLLVE